MRAEQSELTTPRIISRNCACLSPWVTLETVSVAHSEVPEHIEVFHAFRQNDYVHVLTMTRQGTLIVVRQYRPVIERWTLEFPGGLRDPREQPDAAAARELREETGFAAVEMIPLVECHADVGRLSNKFFGFFALADPVAEPEPSIGVALVSGEELRAYAASGRISTSGHICLLYLAAVHPRVRELCRQCGHPVVPWMI